MSSGTRSRRKNRPLPKTSISVTASETAPMKATETVQICARLLPSFAPISRETRIEEAMQSTLMTMIVRFMT